MRCLLMEPSSSSPSKSSPSSPSASASPPLTVLAHSLSRGHAEPQPQLSAPLQDCAVPAGRRRAGNISPGFASMGTHIPQQCWWCRAECAGYVCDGCDGPFCGDCLTRFLDGQLPPEPNNITRCQRYLRFLLAPRLDSTEELIFMIASYLPLPVFRYFDDRSVRNRVANSVWFEHH